MATKNYTSFYDVRIDLGLYLAISTGDVLTLDLLPAVAKDRYQWIVDNWVKLYVRFQNYANGNETLLSALDDFNRSVQSTQLGNPANVLGDGQKINLYSPFLSLITSTEIIPTKDEQDFIRNEQQRINAFDISSFRSMTTYLKNQMVLTAQYIGLGDSNAATLQGQGLAPTKRSATVEDLQVLDQAIDLERFVEGIVVDFKNKQGKPPNLLQAANTNLDPNSGITVLDTYQSYVAVPFEKSLTEMAQKYLGSGDRWFELVTVNNLKAPYVDLYGEKLLLLASGSGSSVTIQDIKKEWLNVGVKIKIGSIKIREQTRIVEKINDNKDGTLTLFLSGERDLSSFKTTESASVRVYQYGTVNESSMIYIPLQTTSPLTKKPTPMSDELRRLTLQDLSFGVDIQKDESTGDFVIDQTGDFQKCYAVNNLRQTIHNILQTQIGDNKWHTEYGITTQIGDTWKSSLTEAQQIGDTITSAVLQDNRIRSCVVTKLEVQGTSLALGLLVVLRDSSIPIPLSFIE